jgi:multidrug efflux system outer membrane protein
VSSNVSAARSDAASVEATYQSVLLAVQADVAQTYFRLRATDAELETLNRTVQTREENVKVNQRRFDLGDIGEFDLSRAKTELASARAEAIGLQRQRATTEHALAVLLGKPAASYTAGNSPLLDSALLPEVPVGMPSTLLERRPDIAAAQRAWRRPMPASAWPVRPCSRR